MAWRWQELLLIQAELVLAFWFLFSGYRAGPRWTAIALFTIFASYNLYLVFLKAPSCGCFGKVEVRPWVTMLLDMAIVLGLVGWGPRAADPHVPARATLATMLVFTFAANVLLLARRVW